MIAVYFIFLRQTAPTAIAGNEIQEFSTSNGGANESHNTPYSYDPEETGVNPPVSGRHNPSPAPCGTHDTRIQDENLVHTLEHGAVGVLFDPKKVEQADVDDIERIVGGYQDHTFSAPYPGMDSPVTVVSWARKMPLDEVDSEAITEYIDTFRNTEPAPESGEDCDNDEDGSFEVQGPASPSPGTSPSPQASPGDDKAGAEGGDDKAGAGEPGGSKMEKEEEGN